MASKDKVEHGDDSELSPSATSSESRESVESSDSDSIHSIPQYTGDAPELLLTPHVSRITEARAVSRSRSRSRSHVSLGRTQTSATNATNTDPAFEVDFEDNDKQNPQDWPLWYKGLVLFAISFSTTTVVMFSTSYTSPIPGLIAEFGVTEQVAILGITVYLIGMAVGSIILAPLSEMYGRRIVYVISMALFTILVLPCALAKNMTTILATRFFSAFAASAMISNAPGSISDMVLPEYRALAFSIWSIGPMNGPVLGPVMGGFVYQYVSWRWTYWVTMIMAGVAWVMISSVPETYAPTILRRRANRKRKETSDERWYSRYDDKSSLWPLLKVNLSRPLVMGATEAILLFWNLYNALVYGILYLCFVAYPIVFSQQRGWAPGISGLAFCGIGVGVLLAIAAEPLIRRVINSHAPDETGKPPPEAMVWPICIASILMPVGELIFAWTCTPNVHWIAPIIAGIPFGTGCTIIFIYSANYLVHSYGIYAASALAGNALLRSVMGATIPLAGPSMYKTLGSNWAGTLLALLAALCIPIPFVFYKYGSRIRRKSALIRRMQEDKERQERKRRRIQEKYAVGDEKNLGVVEEGRKIEEEEEVEEDLDRSVKKRLGAEATVGEVAEPAAAIDEIELEKGVQRGRGRRA